MQNKQRVTERHGQKGQTSVTPSHLPIFVPHSSAVGKVDQGLSKVENVISGQGGAVAASETGWSVSGVLYVCAPASYARQSDGALESLISAI